MTRKSTLILCEGAVCVALSLILSYFKIKIGALGGSLNFTMIPIIVFAVHSGGVKWGVLAGFVFGTLKFFLAEGFAITWQSIVLDYSVAYAAVGLSGVFYGKFGGKGYVYGAILGGLGMFVFQFISGVTIYASYVPDAYLGIKLFNEASVIRDENYAIIEGFNAVKSAAWLYSLLLNGVIVGVKTVASAVICPVLGTALGRVKQLQTV